MIHDTQRSVRRLSTANRPGGPGGHFVRGEGGEKLEIDPVEFWRILSGRGRGENLLAHPLRALT